MSEAHEHGFDEALISGFLDGELTQANEQRVRLHLEDCARCKGLVAELTRIRAAAMATDLPVPDDGQWDEAPRSGLAALLRHFGWLLMLAWIIGLSGFGIYKLATDTEDLVIHLIAFGFWLGLGLVFFSVLLDRLQTRRTDRYRRVEK